MLTDKQIFEETKKGTSPKVTKARIMAEKVAMHLTGEKVEEYLFKLDDYENDAQKALRTKLIKSNKSVLSYLLRPLDKIFTAKGGSISMNTAVSVSKKIKEAITNTLGTDDIKKHLKKSVKDKFIIDPNSILFFDVDENGNPVERIIDSSKQLSYSVKNNQLEWFIYAYGTLTNEQLLENKDIKDKTIYRFIDKNTDITYIMTNLGIVDTDVRIDRNGRTPGVFLGDEMLVTADIHKSIIWDIVEELDEMLRDTSVQTVHKLSHNYPIYWWYSNDCIRCEGEGVIKSEKAGIISEVTCPSCGGDGKHKRKNASDSIVLSVPTNDEPVLAPNVAGVVQPSTEWIAKMIEFENHAISKMFRSLWGDVKQSSGKRETATGRIIDAQPSIDRLRDHSNTFSKIHRHYINEIGSIATGVTVKSSVFYGTRYLLENTDEVTTKIIEAKRDGAPSVLILDLINRYFECEYQNDELELMKRKKLSILEPFPDISASDIIKTGNTDFINKKILYSKFVRELSDEDLILKTQSELQEMFNQFINNGSTN